jgi:hypothetical protein
MCGKLWELVNGEWDQVTSSKVQVGGLAPLLEFDIL